MGVGFSYIGLLMLAMLFVPNLFWTKNRPEGYEAYAAKENRVLQWLERIGEIAVTALSLLCPVELGPWRPWSLWLAGAGLLMLLYEVFWIRYFRSKRTMADFYSSLLGVPVAGAALPVGAFALLAVYGRNPFLGAAAVLLGIGHIGIHWNHRREVRQGLDQAPF